MDNTIHPLIFIVIINLIHPQTSNCQTTVINQFAGVLVPDQVPVIPEGSIKTYTTTVRVNLNPGVVFVASRFQNAAREFYAGSSPVFTQGFNNLNNVRSRSISSNTLEVTYDVSYVYPLLFLAVNGIDSEIQSKIGNFIPVRDGLNSQADILSLYPIVNDASFFSFTGTSICSVAQCNGTYVTCTDVTNGITATCISNCKNGHCYNNGLCFHTDRNVAPTCRCPSFPDLWILGQRCETKIALWLVVLLSVIGFLILLIVLIVVILCVLKRRRKLARKRELLNSAPRSHVNTAFHNDEIRNPENGALDNGSAPRAAPVARDDSFETVTSSEMPPSEYRSNGRGRSRNPSSPTSQYSTTINSAVPNSRRPEPESPRRNRQSSEQSDDKEDNDNDLSFYEVDVNDLDMQSETASSVVAVSSTKSSPIRWLPPKNNNQPRPGWVPSLGPMMYEIPTAKKTNTLQTDQSEVERRRRHGTDV